MKLYISGGMTGIPNKNKLKFEEMARNVKRMGLSPITPFDLDVVQPCDPESWEQNMKRDIKYLMEFDGVVVLDGWENSRGARLEVGLAHLMKLPIFKGVTSSKTKKFDLTLLQVNVNFNISTK